MSGNLIEVTPSAYEFPLLIKHLLHSPLIRSPEQVIVYRDAGTPTGSSATDWDGWPTR